jgi:hypothetical protein
MEKPSTLSDSLVGRREGLGHEEQLGLYASAKKRQEQVSGHMVQHCPDYGKQVEALISCGSWLWFHDFFRLCKVLLRGGITCKQPLLCPPCALRRSAAYTRAYYPVIRYILQQHPDWHPVLITKTIRNGPDLAPLFKQFTGAHSKLMAARRNSFKVNSTVRIKFPTVYASFHGGVGSYEYKRGSGSDVWHPHSHELAFISPADHRIAPVEELRWRKVDGERVQVKQIVYKPVDLQSRLRSEWHKLTGWSWVCDIRMVSWGADGPINDEDSLFGAVSEVMGYCLKMQEISPADQVTAWEVLRGRRLTYSYGCLRNVELPPEAYDTDDEIPADEPWIEREYQYHFGAGRYNLRKVRLQADALFPEPVSSGLPRKGRRKSSARESSEAVSRDAVKDWLASMQVGIKV